MSSLVTQFLWTALVAIVFAAAAATFIMRYSLRLERKLLEAEMAARFERWQREFARQLAELPAARAAPAIPLVSRRPASARVAAPAVASAQPRPAEPPRQAGAFLYAGDPESSLRRQFIPVGARMRIGRSAECDIVFEDATGMSKVHAMLEIGNDQAWLADLNSRNGTFINGRRIAARTPVPDLATLSFGGIEARLVRV